MRRLLLATVRALKCHGGAPIPVPGRPIPEDYKKENLAWVEKGCENLIHHIGIVKRSGMNPVVCLNAFGTDTKNEVNLVKAFGRKCWSSFCLVRALG